MATLAEIMATAGKFGEDETSKIRPIFNIGAFFDVITGFPVQGKWGNMIINGGIWAMTGIVGPNNSYKSTLSKHFALATLANYSQSTAMTLDTEISGTGGIRYTELGRRYSNLVEVDFSDTPRWTYTTNANVYGDVWWEMCKQYCKVKHDNAKITQMTTPIVDKNGDYVKAYIPTVFEIDSLSQFTVESLEIKVDGKSVGSKERNMEDMASSKAKSKMIREMPSTLNRSGGCAVMTAHVGQQFEMDMYNPSMKKHAIMGNRTIKYASGAFDYNMNNLFEIVSAKPMINASTKAPEFPRNSDEEFRGDTDLYELSIRVVRGKAGSSAMVFPVICSQSEGFLAELSNFWYLKSWKYGFTGNDRSYSIDLYPDEKLSRTTVRDKLDSNPLLARAMRLQADLLLIQHSHKLTNDFPAERVCTPAELYNDIKALGYDWNDLLNTQNEWSFREDQQEKPTLTIYDLLNMRAGLYKPYWLQEGWLKENKGEKFGKAP